MSACAHLLHRNERRLAYPLRRLVSAYAATLDYAGRVVGPLPILYLRLWLATAFFAVAWNGQPVPGLAPPAKQGGIYVARVIRSRIAGRRASQR